MPSKRAMLLSLTALTAVAPPVLAQEADDTPAAEILVVTATRKEASLATVPLSVQAFSEQDLDFSGVKQFEDLVRLSPGVTLNEAGGSGANNVAIRGIASDAGAATTGIYINDVPIQVRNLAYGAATLFPNIFDLERVEVLRGPQGTLFGSGSEGGTIRFILSQPSLDEASGRARAEVASTAGGDLSYETSAAYGAPIIEGKLGFRASASYRRQGGYIDRVLGDLTINDPTGASGPGSATFDITETPYEDSNWEETQAYRAALAAALTDTLTVTPSIMYQRQELHDNTNSFWYAASDPDEDRYATPLNRYIPGVGSEMTVPELPEGVSEFYMPAVELEWNPEGVAVYSTTSYLDLKKNYWYDFTDGYVWYYPNVFPTPPGWKTMAVYADESAVFQQEIRFQSDTDSRFNWLAGAFYSSTDQNSQEPIYSNWFDLVDSWFGIPNLDGGDPFGPGSTNGQNVWGYPPGENGLNYFHSLTVEEEQIAAFGQLSYELLPNLTATAGVRISKNDFGIVSAYDGWENNGNAPFGSPCPDGETCVFGDPDGPYAPIFPGGEAHSSETSTTPKFTLSYQATPDLLVYANVAKGFRPGGGQARLPTVCDTGLIRLGYVDENGNPETPEGYGSDSVWNYEVGAKTTVLDGRVFVDVNAYSIKWEGVQAQVFAPICGISFIDNLGEATAEGVDFAASVEPLDQLSFTFNLAYNKATFDTDVLSPAGGLLFSSGTPLPDAGPPWTASLSGDYEMLVADLPWYGHVDVTYQSALEEFGSTDPNSVSYNPLVVPNGESTLVNLRVGTYIGDADISLFVSNLFNERRDGYSSDEVEGLPTAAILEATTFRPRTIGVTATVRY